MIARTHVSPFIIERFFKPWKDEPIFQSRVIFGNSQHSWITLGYSFWRRNIVEWIHHTVVKFGKTRQKHNSLVILFHHWFLVGVAAFVCGGGCVVGVAANPELPTIGWLKCIQKPCLTLKNTHTMEIPKLILHLQQPPLALEEWRFRICHATFPARSGVIGLALVSNAFDGFQLTAILVSSWHGSVLTQLFCCAGNVVHSGTNQVEYIKPNEKEGKYQPNESCLSVAEQNIMISNKIQFTLQIQDCCFAAAGDWKRLKLVFFVFSAYDIWVSVVLQAAPSYKRWSGTFQVP